ncbi:hypothetical protein DH2020_049371 [Rehmannia glutinosa]|uniref:Uncharacterized protein n=1 Tax=Rehmannia glutinosa TaxID=99300 RepID=A0ABR0U3U4_REHGL
MEQYSRFPLSLTNTIVLLVPALIFLLIKKWNKSRKPHISVKLPPGPKTLPIIGHVHLMSALPYRSFRHLAEQFGPLMHLKFGEAPIIVISSPEIAKLMLKEHDPNYAGRPEGIVTRIMWYDYIDIIFSPHNDYWRQMRKICIVELLSAKTSVLSDPLGTTREFAIADLFPSWKILSTLSKPRYMKMRRKLDVILDDIINEHKENLAKMARENGDIAKRGNGEFGKEDLVDVFLRIKENEELEFPIGNDNIKAVIYDIFVAGTETSSTTIDWTMAELMRNPRVMAKAQAEVREVFKGNKIIEENDVQKLKYLKLVIKETLRLHPPIPIILRASREEGEINGYTIPAKTKVFVNIWGMQRDPKYWTNPEDFEPERFENQALDFVGGDFEYIPFGTGKRMCPGMTFGLASVELPLAQLLYSFDWKLPDGGKPESLDMIENPGLTATRKNNLVVVPKSYEPLEKKMEYYSRFPLNLASTIALLVPAVLFLLIKKWNKSRKAHICVKLPPGPQTLPVIGHLHLMSTLPYRSFRHLAEQFGPIMLLKFCEVPVIVVSSPEIAKQILKDNDPNFAERSESIVTKIMWYNSISIAFSPYGDYWRQMRKICAMELLSAKNVRSFGSIRNDEVSGLIKSIQLSSWKAH